MSLDLYNRMPDLAEATEHDRSALIVNAHSLNGARRGRDGPLVLPRVTVTGGRYLAALAVR
ncbi:MAG: hypothetical protein IKG22_04875 [Atopobiaceae bacterium]|nr:hypothetical protein [Atopobiaceae bacterium]